MVKSYTRWIVAVAVLAAVVLGGAFAMQQDGGDGVRLPFDLGTSASAGETGPSAETDLASVPKVIDEPTPPDIIFTNADSGDGASGDPADDSAYQAYLAQTAGVVTNNSEGLRTLGLDALTAYLDGEPTALAAAFAPDEDLSTGDAETMMARYPALLSGDIADNVNVYAIGQATVYVYYLNVTWTDGGLESSHSIEVPMRFIDDSWYLSSITPSSWDSKFVQLVVLP
jgi:hypothetical protein